VHAVLHVIEGSKHHDGDEHRGAIGAELAADIEAVDVGEHQIEQHDVGMVFPGHPQRGLAIFGEHRPKSARAQDPGDEIRLFWMVFYNKGRTRRHAVARRSKGVLT
jgi:hypothetical protein